MKVWSDFGSFMCLNITDYHPQKVSISTQHFSPFNVHIEDILDCKEIKEIIIKTTGEIPFSIELLRSDGWQINIGDEFFDREGISITRIYREPDGKRDYNKNKQYLTKNGEWRDIHKNWRMSTCPKESILSDAMRIPLLVLDKEKVKV